MTAEPFPFAALEAISRAEVEAARRLRRAARPLIEASSIEGALSEIVHERVDVIVRRIRRFDAKNCRPEAIAVALAPPETARMVSAALVEIEAPLAAAIIARALKHKPARVVDSSRAPSAEIIGAIAAVVLATVRRAHKGTPLAVVAAGPAHALGADLASVHRAATTAWLTVVLGADAFDARVTLPDAVLPSEPHASLDGAALARFGDLPLGLPLVVATALASRAELNALGRGDAFIVPRFPLRSDGDDLVGPVALVAPRSERGLGADLAGGARLVLRGLLEAHPWEHEAMANDQSATTIEVLDDAPVVVRVELGSVEMKAREWAAISPGDVVALGRKLGAPAILRVGGVEVARGELVQVDGEYGVRILGTARAQER